MSQPSRGRVERFTGTPSGFVAEVASRVVQGTLETPLLTIGTTRSGFSPALNVGLLMRDRPDLDRLLVESSAARNAASVLSMLQHVGAGGASDAHAFRRLLAKSLQGSRSRDRGAVVFDLMYAALQLAAAADGPNALSIGEMQPVDALIHLAALSRSVLGNEDDADAHVAHFMVHAAAFLCSRDGVSWPDFEDSVQDRLDLWGEDPTDTAILRHAVVNLGIAVAGQPLDDREYDVIREGRRAIREGRDAAEIMSGWCRTLGWRRADRLVQILAPHLREQLHHFARTVVEGAGSRERERTARELGYLDSLGRPLVRGERSVDRVRIQFPGGSGIGRSCLIYEGAGRRVAVDFGGVDHNRLPSWTPELLDLDAILITHAHHDHIGGLLALYEQFGYRGPWYASSVTIRCVELAVEDSLKLHQVVDSDEVEDEARLERLMDFARPVPNSGLFDLGDLRVHAYPSGHVPGSLQFLFEAKTGSGTHRTMVSGDINPGRCLSVEPLEYPSSGVRALVDVLVVEGTNAYRPDAIVDGPTGGESLRAAIRSEVRRPVLVPTMSLGRAQEVIAALGETEWRVGVFGLAARMTAAIGSPLPSNVTLVSTKAKRTRREDFDVLIASAGCLQGGPSKWFWEESTWNPPIVLTGYLFPGTPAHARQHEFPIVRFSGHASNTDWQGYVSAFPVAQRFLVHYPGQREVARKDGFTVPRPGRMYEFAARRVRPTIAGQQPRAVT